MSDAWPFKEPRTFGVFCSRAIFEQGKAIRLVAHDEDGSWQFLDGEPITAGDTPVHVHLEHVMRLDPSVGEVSLLPKGWIAEREERGAGWSTSSSEHDS
jgi:hypothetical protein